MLLRNARKIMLGDAEVSRIHLGPDLVYRSSYYLHAAAGAFDLTGKAASQMRTVPHQRGSFVSTGQDAGMLAGRRLAAASGLFAFAGQNADMRQLNRYSAERGLFGLGGQSAGLVASRRLTAAAGSISLAGQVSAPAVLRKLTADRGSFHASGKDALFASGAAVDLTYLSYQSGALATTPVTVPSCALGDAAPARRIYAIVHYYAGTQFELLSATIAGVPADIHANATGLYSSTWNGCAIISAEVPAGTVADVVLTFPAGKSAGCLVATYRAMNIQNVAAVDAEELTVSSQFNYGVSLDVLKGGIVLAGCMSSTALGSSFVNMDSRYSWQRNSTLAYLGASRLCADTEANQSVSVTNGTYDTNGAFVAASFR